MADDSLFAPIVAQLRIVDHQNEAISLLIHEQRYGSKGKKYAFIQHRTMLKMIQRNYDNFNQFYVAKSDSKASIYMGLTCFLFKSKFPYLKQFNRFTFYIFSSGIYQSWLNNELRHTTRMDKTLDYYNDEKQLDDDDDDDYNNHNNNNDKNSFHSLTLSQVMTCFHLYMIVLFIAILVAIIEFLWFKTALIIISFVQSVIIVGQSINQSID